MPITGKLIGMTDLGDKVEVVLLTTSRDDTTLHYGATVEVWPTCADDLAPGECTPENYAHLKARLVAAADNLAREVRSNQAAALVRADLEARCAEADECLAYRLSRIAETRKECDDAYAELELLRAANALLHAEVTRLLESRAECMAALDLSTRTIQAMTGDHTKMQAEIDRLAAELAAALGELGSLYRAVTDAD